MAYIDNLIDWGDALFGQYTGETIDQARMLYILAFDLLGPRPEHLGTRRLAQAQYFGQLRHTPGEYDFLLRVAGGDGTSEAAAVAHASIATGDAAPDDGDTRRAYFVIPENDQLADYWSRVEDRLHKIRLSQNILGVSQPVPLFEPPVDPMALVRAAARGADPTAVAALAPVPVPQRRFPGALAKAQELVDRLTQLGMDLLSVSEKRDA